MKKVKDPAEEFLRKYDPTYSLVNKRTVLLYNYHSESQIQEHWGTEIAYSNLSMKQKLQVQSKKMQPEMVKEE